MLTIEWHSNLVFSTPQCCMDGSIMPAAVQRHKGMSIFASIIDQCYISAPWKFHGGKFPRERQFKGALFHVPMELRHGTMAIAKKLIHSFIYQKQKNKKQITTQIQWREIYSGFKDIHSCPSAVNHKTIQNEN